MKDQQILHVYVDGSWKKHKPEIAGWGFIVLDSEKRLILERSGVIECVSRQVDGELYATLKSLEYLKYIRVLQKVYLYYDYAGIEAWANKTWKAKSDVSIEYVNRLEKYKELLKKVTFVKVKSHSNTDKWNDYVDILAKSEVDKFRN